MAEIDLNLLRVFDTLIEVRSVTRAAGRLGLTQSAVSHALARLRNALDDPLFVRAPGGLQPTARALEIAPGVREGLGQLRGALSPTEFVPETAQRRFTLAAGSYFCTLLVPELIARVRAIASEVTLRIVSPGPELLSELDEGGVDLALGAFTRIPSRLSSEALYREELVWIAAAGNPIAEGAFDPQVFAAAPRVTVSVGRPSDALRYDGVLERRLIAETGETGAFAGGGDAGIVYDGITAIGVVARTDMIALVPRRFAERDDPAHGVVALNAPEEGGIDLMMLWHGKVDDDPGLAWLRGLIREIVSAL